LKVSRLDLLYSTRLHFFPRRPILPPIPAHAKGKIEKKSGWERMNVENSTNRLEDFYCHKM
jgi:hypothetical protein